MGRELDTPKAPLQHFWVSSDVLPPADAYDDANSISVLMSQWFAPTRLIVTFEKDGQGGFIQDDIERIVVRDKTGNVVGLDLPNKSIIIANHQVRDLPI